MSLFLNSGCALFYKILSQNQNPKIVNVMCQLCHKKSSTYTRDQDICPDSKSEKMSVGCKVAIVNGGTSGIGLAAASQLLCHGARNVTITGHDACKGKEAASLLNNTYGMGKAMFLNCNVNCMNQFEDAFRETVNSFKSIDIVVNAVGVCDGTQWEREIVTNIIGTIRGTLLGYRFVGKEGCGKGGVIVNLAGVSAVQPLPPAPTLCAAHHAIVGLSRSFGHTIHTKKSGVRVVCLCPGFTATQFIKNISTKAMTDSLGRDLDSFIKKSTKQGPDPCGHAVIHLIKHGENGSVWLCEGARLFLLNIPNKKTYSTLIAQYL